MRMLAAQVQDALRAVVVVAVIPAVDQQREPPLDGLHHRRCGGIVHAEFLHVRVNLDALEALIHDVAHRRLHVLHLRVNRREGHDALRLLRLGAEDEAVDAAHVVGGQRHRVRRKAGEARLVLLAQTVLQGAASMHRNAVVERAHAGRRLFRDFVRIDVHVYVENLHCNCPLCCHIQGIIADAGEICTHFTYSLRNSACIPQSARYN